MNRGSKGWYDRYQDRKRFNEAPIHESGKCWPPRWRPRRSRSFNEAPIHESGKFTRLHSWVEVNGRFNEAPIHESGKWEGRRTPYRSTSGLQ